MSKLSNVLSMLEILSSGKKYSIKELADLLEVSPRMIRVYKDELEIAGIYIDTLKGPYGGYILNQEVNVPKRFIAPSKLKIENKDTYNLVNRAIKEKRKLKIEYLSKDYKTVSKRTIVPYNIVAFGSTLGIAAYCELRQELRHFYLNRIKKIEII